MSHRGDHGENKGVGSLCFTVYLFFAFAIAPTPRGAPVKVTIYYVATGRNDPSAKGNILRPVGGGKSTVALRLAARPLRATIWPKPYAA